MRLKLWIAGRSITARIPKISLCALLVFAGQTAWANDEAVALMAVYQEQAKSRQLSQDVTWRRLLHVQQHGLLPEQSETSDVRFFLHTHGRKNPDLELEAMLSNLLNVQRGDLDALQNMCRFPARYKWLQQQLSLPNNWLDWQQCSEYQAYLTNFAAQKMYLSFSSYFLGAPASAYGHTLMRLERRGARVSDPLQDDALNYGANVTTDNPVLYALYGLMGNFNGSLVAQKYYYKIREYNDYESRDMWEYELNLTDAQIGLMQDHMWELAHVEFSYYYMDENCSYFLLKLIELAHPEANFIDQLPVYTLPVDTIKIVKNHPELVKAIHYRPSAHRKALEAVEPLDNAQWSMFQALALDRRFEVLTSATNDANPLTPVQLAEVMDATMAYWDYKYSLDVLLNQGDVTQWRNQMLIQRSRLPSVKINAKEIPEDELPHLAHGSQRWGVGGYQMSPNGGWNSALNYRLTMHGILDPFVGEPRNSTLEFFNIEVVHDHEQQDWYWENLAVLRVLTLNPWTRLDKPSSYALQMGWRRTPTDVMQGSQQTSSHEAYIDGEWGVSWALGKDWIVNPMMHMQARYTGAAEVNADLAVGAAWHVYRWWGKTATTHLTLGYDNWLESDVATESFTHETRWHAGQDWSVSLFNRWQGDTTQHGFMLYHYY